jgi:pyruvate ferredoxin oxidoreductase delta subunit
MAIKKFDSKYEACWSDADARLLCLNTGEWRTKRPVVDKDKCSYCGLCYLYCPLQCIIDKENFFEPDLTYCKGCGICAHECPKHAIAMISEQEF